mmetsp:Transcript_96915/g.260635  ORF Transcript_96915/g.260635 Transcript_96915/m.260635 type:complete len:324 (+) Transcript_96915:38-1009(+)
MTAATARTSPGPPPRRTPALRPIGYFAAKSEGQGRGSAFSKDSTQEPLLMVQVLPSAAITPANCPSTSISPAYSTLSFLLARVTFSLLFAASLGSLIDTSSSSVSCTRWHLHPWRHLHAWRQLHSRRGSSRWEWEAWADGHSSRRPRSRRRRQMPHHLGDNVGVLRIADVGRTVAHDILHRLRDDALGILPRLHARSLKLDSFQFLRQRPLGLHHSFPKDPGDHSLREEPPVASRVSVDLLEGRDVSYRSLHQPIFQHTLLVLGKLGHPLLPFIVLALAAFFSQLILQLQICLSGRTLRIWSLIRGLDTQFFQRMVRSLKKLR